jgi:DNA-binding NtrC family response regulator
MKITIIDSDLNFVNALLLKLNENGYETKHISDLDKIRRTDNSDIYLLSSDFSQRESERFIKNFKNKTIIILATVYSDITVRYPLDVGAKDYLVKPFRMIELERKLDYFRLKKSINSYQLYMKYSFGNIDGDIKSLSNLDLPMIIHTNHTVFIDKLIMEYCQRENKIFSFISLSSYNWELKIRKTPNSHLIYISNFHMLNEKEVFKLFKILKNRIFILSTTKDIKTSYKTIKVDADMQLYDGSYILSIEEYIQYIIKNFQYKVSDTELAKQLDFSRKTLYDRRNKYKIYKTKEGMMVS